MPQTGIVWKVEDFYFNASIENNILKGYCILITKTGLAFNKMRGLTLPNLEMVHIILLKMQVKNWQHII